MHFGKKKIRLNASICFIRFSIVPFFLKAGIADKTAF
ncbi:MAG: hypothetical protein RIS64_975 [Bacteroidota bacterium]|jgi:hypothetical protein